jgi:hypothetical protein
VLNSTSDKEAKEQSDLTYLRINLKVISLRISAIFFLNKVIKRHIREEIQDETRSLLLITSTGTREWRARCVGSATSAGEMLGSLTANAKRRPPF